MSKKTETAKQRRLERERKIRRDAITDIAAKSFIENGYDATMVDMIASNAGYTKASIYNYFDSKDDLFTAVISKTYETLFDTLNNLLHAPGTKYELRTMGDAYLAFVESYPDQAALFDSGRIGLIIRAISEKEEKEQKLTESEKEFKENLLRVQELMTDVIVKTMRESGVEGKVEPFKVIMALSSLNTAIRELVMRGKAGGQTEEETKENLSVLFNIIDQGLKHYDGN
ncbi:MAG: TetR/AcrR family transcriptional regulator [Candidatus Thorarchaeota archaeon]